MLSDRRCAVTVISSIEPVVASELAFVGSAACAATDTPLRIAATAYETFEFIRDSPRIFVRTTTVAALVVSTGAMRIFAGVWKMLIEQTRHSAVTSRLFEDAAASGVAICGPVRLQAPCGGGEPVGVLELP